MARQDKVDIWALTDLCTPWCVHVVATLRIADHIDAGITPIEDLAAASGTDSDSLRRVLRHLVGKGMFEEPAPGRFALNEPARGTAGLVSTSRSRSRRHWRSHGVRLGEPAQCRTDRRSGLS